MRKSKVSKLASADDPTPVPAPPSTAVASGPHPIGTVVLVPKSEQEAAAKHVKLIREILLALGEADFAVALAETKRNELRVEYQKIQEKHKENMRVVARIAGIDIEGPGQWDFNADQMAFTRQALGRGRGPPTQVRRRQCITGCSGV